MLNSTMILSIFSRKNNMWVRVAVIIAVMSVSCFAVTLHSAVISVPVKHRFSDSTHSHSPIDSTEKKRQVTDTIQPYKPLRSHGSMVQLPYSFLRITKQELQYMNFIGLHDIISQKVSSIYPLHLGSYGQVHGLSIFGSGLRDVSMQFNGRSLNERMMGAVNTEEYPSEMVEQIEIFTGTDAVLFSDNASGMLINLQERVFNTKTPFTHLWYSQGGYDYIASDGIFSQNIAKNWNATIGYRRQSSGSRFVNSALDLWNIRANLRWNPSDATSFTLSELFTHQRIGANGGIDSTSPSIGNELLAVTVYPEYSQRVYRHDLTLAGTTLLSGDTTNSLAGTLYYSSAVWQKNRPRSMAVTPSDTLPTLETTSLRVGTTLKYEQSFFNLTTLRIGGVAEYQSAGQTVYNEPINNGVLAGYGHIYQKLSDYLGIRGGVRLSLQNGVFVPSFGAAASMKSSDNIALTFDISQSSRVPSLSEGLSLLSEKHLLTLAGIQYSYDSLSFGMTGYVRFVRSPIISSAVRDTAGQILTTISSNGDSRQIYGFTTQAKYSYKSLSASGFLQLYQSSEDLISNQRFPLFYAGVSAQYMYSVGQSVMYGGLSVSFIGLHSADEFIPQTWSSIPARTSPSYASFNGIDAFIVLRLGNAYVRATYKNIVSQTWYYVSIYPQLDRNLHLSVSWSFFD